MSRRAPVALAAGSVVSGLLAYVLFALLTRGLGAEAAAPVSVLWTQWTFAAAALTFPLQHWVTRSMVAGHAGDVRAAAARIGGRRARRVAWPSGWPRGCCASASSTATTRGSRSWSCW